MELEVRHLRVVCAIDDCGSLTRAAASLQVTQPGLSAQLRRIETMLGGRLFERTSAGLAATPLGVVVLARARAVLPTLDELMDTAAVTAGSASDVFRLRLGAIAGPLLGCLVTATVASLPQAVVSTRGYPTAAPLVDDVAHGRLECAVVGDSPGYEMIAPAGVVLREVVREPVFALLPATHPLAARAEVDLCDLAGEDWAMPHPQDRTPEYWSRAMSGRKLAIRHRADGRLLVELVRHGHAVSLCQVTFDEVPGVAVRPLVGDPLWFRHLLAWHRDGPLAEVGDLVTADVRRAYEAACAAHPAYQRWRAARPEPDVTASSPIAE
ncbi:LysR family transcriptional regulator [Longispora sp. NPDC051575]|uniref:LysR family transcriptional regulator n=1 Tax=Longispora sp. NPDC051575 TaxID=3154943 RepID=UPI00342627AE